MNDKELLTFLELHKLIVSPKNRRQKIALILNEALCCTGLFRDFLTKWVVDNKSSTIIICLKIWKVD